MKELLRLWSLVAFALFCSLGVAQTREEKIREVRQIWAHLPVLPTAKHDLGIRRYYLEQLELLHSGFRQIVEADDEKRPDSTVLRRLDSDSYFELLRAQSLLYWFIHTEYLTLGDDLEKWALPTYLDKRGRTDIPAPNLARLELATRMYLATVPLDTLTRFENILHNATTFSWLDAAGWSFYSAKITSSGLLQMTSGSERMGDFLHAYPGQLRAGLDDYLEQLRQLVLQVTDPQLPKESDFSLDEVEKLRRVSSSVNWEIDYSYRILTEVLPQLESIRRARGADLATIEQAVADLGDGLKWVLEYSQAFYESALQRKSCDWRAPVGTILTLVQNDIYELLGTTGYGGSVVNQYSRTEDHAEFLPVYKRLQLVKYILVAGSTISRIVSSPEVKARLGEKLFIGIGRAAARLSGGLRFPGTVDRAMVATGAGAESSLSSSRSPIYGRAAENVERRQSEAEARLWDVFFQHAGLLNEVETCGGQLLLQYGRPIPER